MRTWLKTIRDREGLTQKMISTSIDMSQSHYSEIENGEANPSIKTAKVLAKALNFSRHGVSWTKFYETENERKEVQSNAKHG